jgi:hypothetical protein
VSRLLSSLTQKETLEIDHLIKQEADEANNWMLEAGFPQADYDAVVKYRDGYCGVSSDCVLNYLSTNGFDMDKIKKINPSGDLGGDTHYLVSDGTNILEPSYKQFLYTTVLDRTQSYNLKEVISEGSIAEIEQLPGVFLGTPQQLKEKITETLINVHQEEKLKPILKNYGLLFNNEQIVNSKKGFDLEINESQIDIPAMTVSTVPNVSTASTSETQSLDDVEIPQVIKEKTAKQP